MALSFVVIPFLISFFRSLPFAPAPAATSEAAPAGKAFPFRRPATGSARPALKRAAAQPSECGGESTDARSPPEESGQAFRTAAPQRLLRPCANKKSASGSLRHNLLIYKSGKRDSNPRPSAWEADALPTELFPQKCRSGAKIEVISRFCNSSSALFAHRRNFSRSATGRPASGSSPTGPTGLSAAPDPRPSIPPEGTAPDTPRRAAAGSRRRAPVISPS